MAHAGVASRRKSEEMISQGRVRVNDKVVKQMGFKVSKDDIVAVDGKIIATKEEKVYYLLNKPVNYITTTDDQFNRKTVVGLIKTSQRIYPVGRLDYDSTGLLLLTNDGELTHLLTHPSYEIWKSYSVEVNTFLEDNVIKALRKGVELDDGVTAPAKTEIIHREYNYTKIIIEIHEGKNRQVRRMFAHFGIEVAALHRIKIGPLKIGNLKTGEYRRLSNEEIELLKEIKDEHN